MKNNILKVLNLIDQLARAVERGDTDLSGLREEVEKFYLEVKEVQE
jgi:hypothetical protein